MKKYTFTAHTFTACGPNFPEGKTFPARYPFGKRIAAFRSGSGHDGPFPQNRRSGAEI